MLDAVHITKTVGKTALLQDVSVQVGQGGVISLLGPSGSGKTTLLRIVMGLETHEQGELRWHDTLLSDGDGARVRAEDRGFSLFFQEFSLFPHLNVRRNIELGLGHLSKAARRERVMELLALLDIAPLRDRPIDHLSGGEQQRVALARTLAVQPQVLLLDEPFSNVDQMIKQTLYERLQAWLRAHGTTTVIATHDQAEAFFFSDRIYVLRDGRVVDQNTPSQLYARPATAWVAAFVGETNYLTGAELRAGFGLDDDRLRDDRHYLVRPEEFECAPDAPANATVERLWLYGFYREILAKLDNGRRVRVKDLHRADLEEGGPAHVRMAKPLDELVHTEQQSLETDDR